MISHRAPPGVTNFESNYLAAVDFYDEDFPWRYTPAPAPGLQLCPWIALIVLKETEFAEGKNIANRPLPFITISDPSVFPPAGELWAWAHVHFNQGLSANAGELVSPDMSAGVAARAGDPQRQSRPRLLASAVSALAGRQHRLRRVCDSGV